MKLIKANEVLVLPIMIHPYHTFRKRLKGLMFRTRPITNEGIHIAPCNSIHMFFMFFAIDVVFLNEKSEIIYMKENVKPWTVIFPVKHANSALELPVNTISKYSLKVGERVDLDLESK